MLSKLGVDRRTVVSFIAVALCSQMVYSVDALRNVAFNAYRETLGVTFVEIGFLYTVTGIVQLICYAPAGWIVNRFSNRALLLGNSLATAVLSLLLICNVGYPYMVLIFCVFGLTKEAIFWTAVMRSVRCIAPNNRQGTAFGALELLRGLLELTTNIIAVVAIAWMSQAIAGIKFAIYVDVALMVAAGAAAWLLLPADGGVEGGTAKEKNRAATRGLVRALKMPAVWLTGVNAGCVYAVYICLMYFAPFLQDVYALPLATVAIFALANSSGVRMLSSPIGGLIGDNYFKSSAHFMKLFFMILCFLSLAIIAMPVNAGFAVPLMILFVVVSISIYMLRGVYFAPSGEMGVPHEISGAAMSVASLTGYSPSLWMFLVVGWLIDSYPGERGYYFVFILMTLAATTGFVCSSCLASAMKKARAACEI